MNAYVAKRCRSEQQLLNELARLLAAKEVASKRMTELLCELAFFFVHAAPSAVSARFPHALLRDLSVLLVQLRDKKDEMRLARLVLCFLARLLARVPHGLAQQSPVAASAVTGVVQALEAHELSHSVLPRQLTALKLYASLCPAVQRSDALIQRLVPLLQRSPLWALYTTAASDRKALAATYTKKEFVAAAATLGAALHCVRHHVPPQTVAAQCLEHVVSAAWLSSPHTATAGATRHATATLLLLLQPPPPDSEMDATAQAAVAQQVVAQLERFMARVRPRSLLLYGDHVATITLVSVAGIITRLPLSADERGAAAPPSDLLDIAFDTPTPTPALATPTTFSLASPRTRTTPTGVTVSSALVSRLRVMLVDLLTDSPAGSIAPCVRLAALHELMTTPSAINEPIADQGGVTLLALAQDRVLLPLLAEGMRSHREALLHRVLRAVQTTAEAVDRDHHQHQHDQQQRPPLDSRLTALTNAVTQLLAAPATVRSWFVETQALLALVWLLPRSPTDDDAAWLALHQRLLHRRSPIATAIATATASASASASAKTRATTTTTGGARHQLAEALLLRATTPHSHVGVDVTMLRRVLHLIHAWAMEAPADWHAALVDHTWTVALHQAEQALGHEVLGALVDVLDTSPAWLRQPHGLELQQSALAFLVRVGAGSVVRLTASSAGSTQDWSQQVLLRLSKHLLLGSQLSRRLSVRVLQELRQQARIAKASGIEEHATVLLACVARAEVNEDGGAGGPSGKRTEVMATQIHTAEVKQTLGIQDLLQPLMVGLRPVERVE